MMLSTVEEFINNANYFTIELKRKFDDYEIQLQPEMITNGKANWKQFFTDTYVA